MPTPKRPINQDRRPRLPMTASGLVELLRQIEAAGIEVWLDGGWGVDALLEGQRRERCLTPESQMLCHAGYEFDEDDIADLDALRERFAVAATPASSRE